MRRGRSARLRRVPRRRLLALVAPAGAAHPAAALLHAAELRAATRLLLDDERRLALRALLGDRAVPQHEVALALRVVRAAVEHLALLAALLGEEADAALRA